MSGITHIFRLGKINPIHPCRQRVPSVGRPFYGTRFLAEQTFPGNVRPDVPLEPRPRSRLLRRSLRVVRYTSYFALSAAFGVLALGAGVFIHDAFTYTDRHVDRVPVSPLALHPVCGGPKNLPVVSVLLADEEDEEAKKLTEKQKLVIVGGGWGVSVRQGDQTMTDAHSVGYCSSESTGTRGIPCHYCRTRDVHDVHAPLTL